MTWNAPPVVARTPEGKVKDGIKAWLDEHGAYWYMVVPTGYSRAGVPDFIACVGGRFVGIEAKAPGKRRTTTPLQRKELRAIDAAHGVAIVVDDASQLNTLLGGDFDVRTGAKQGSGP